jgi:hypothetical protein
VKDDMIPLATAALRLKRSYLATRDLVFTGTLEGEQRGRLWFVRTADVERLVRERERDAGEKVPA